MTAAPSTAQRLLSLYDRVAEAEDAIPRLRRFVLDLAVRGKLVEQDPSDDPADQSFVSKPQNDSGTVQDSASLSPVNWSKLRLGSLVTLTKGKKPISLNTEWQGLPYLDIAALERGELRQFSTDTRCPFVQNGDLVLVCDGSRSGLVLDGREGILGSTLAKVTFSGFERDYLKVLFRALYENLNGAKKGAAIPHLDIPRFLSLSIFLPPLAEQRRIVAKVDELMALCDRLQAAREGREAVRSRLTTATLARLTAPESEDETHAQSNAHFALQTLPHLTTHPTQIKSLRRSILNLAVRGKLVAQDPTDEPAAELLKRIAETNSRIQKLKGIRGGKAAETATGFEALGDVPGTWRRTHLQEIAYQITDGTHLTPRYTPTGKPFLSAQNVKPFRFMPDQYRFVSEQDFDGYRANRKPERGDVLLTRVGAGIGEAAVLDSDFEFAFYVSLCLIKVPVDLFLPEYLVIWLNSPEGRASSTSRTYGKGASQGNLNLSMIRTFEIPLPPLAEQHRIVARVDALMALCDQLEASLTTATTTRSRLLEALLHEALDGQSGVAA